MTAPIEGHPVYEWKTYHNEKGSQIEIAEVPEDHPGHIVTYGGQTVPVKAGDRVARTTRPDEFVVVSDFDDWNEGEVGANDVPEDDDTVPVEADRPDDYDPENDTVVGVKRELQRARDNGDEARFNTILENERDGKNRAGIVNQEF